MTKAKREYLVGVVALVILGALWYATNDTRAILMFGGVLLKLVGINLVELAKALK